MLVLITNGELYTPERAGRSDVLIGGGSIRKIGSVDRRALDLVEPDYYVIDATGQIIAPGFIDPLAHVLATAGSPTPSS